MISRFVLDEQLKCLISKDFCVQKRNFVVNRCGAFPIKTILSYSFTEKYVTKQKQIDSVFLCAHADRLGKQ